MLLHPFQHSTTWGSVVAGGLGDYGSDESEDEDNRSVRGSESSDTDEEELHHRIREKQDAFRRKEREMLLQQEKQAQEALLARGKTMFVCARLDQIQWGSLTRLLKKMQIYRKQHIYSSV